MGLIYVIFMMFFIQVVKILVIFIDNRFFYVFLIFGLLDYKVENILLVMNEEIIVLVLVIFFFMYICMI